MSYKKTAERRFFASSLLLLALNQCKRLCGITPERLLGESLKPLRAI